MPRYKSGLFILRFSGVSESGHSFLLPMMEIFLFLLPPLLSLSGTQVSIIFNLLPPIVMRYLGIKFAQLKKELIET